MSTIVFNGSFANAFLTDPGNESCSLMLGTKETNACNCIIFDNGVFENFKLADEPFAKALKLSLKLVHWLIMIYMED